MESSRNTTSNSICIIPQDKKQQIISTKLESSDKETVYDTSDDNNTNPVLITFPDEEDIVQEVVTDSGDETLSISDSFMEDHTYVCKQEVEDHPLHGFLKDIDHKPNKSPCSSPDPGYESFTASPPHTENFNYDAFINWDLFPSLE